MIIELLMEWWYFLDESILILKSYRYSMNMINVSENVWKNDFVLAIHNISYSTNAGLYV